MPIRYLSGVNVDSNTLVVDAANDRVGIGTATPSVELAIYQSSTPRLHLQNSTSGTTSTDGFQIALSGVDGYLWNWENGPTIFGTNNAERMRITAAGNVGIGTTGPNYKLQVAGTVSILNGASDTLLGGSALYLEGGSGSNYTILQQGVGRFTIWGYSGSSWGEKFTINNTSGNVGIGTTSPTVALDVNGTINGGFLTISRAETTAVFTDTRTNIHTTTPSFIVQNTGDTSVTTLYHRLVDLDYAGDADTVTGTYVRFLTGGTERAGLGLTSDKFTITTGVTERLTIDASGNVGIGTTSPTTALHVVGLTQIVESGNTAFYGGNYVRVFNDQNFNIRNVSGTTIANISVNGASYFNGGNVGIGTTTPSQKLEVSGALVVGMTTPAPFWNALFKDYSDGSGVYISSVNGGGGKYIAGNAYYYNSALWRSDKTVASAINLDNGTVVFYTNSGLTANTDFTPSERLRITSAGNVGIGTTSPGELLEVVGNIRANVSNGGGFMLTGASASGLVRAGATGLALRTDTTDRLTIDNTGAATFSSTISSGGNINVGSQLTFTPAEARIISGSSTIAINNNANTTNLLLIHNSTGNVGIGTNVDAGFKLDVSGTGRFTGALTAQQGLSISGVGGLTNSANKINIDFNSGNARFYSLGANASTKGSFEFHTNSSDGSLDVIALGIASTGAATFSSSVTATNLNLTDAGGGAINNVNGNLFIQTPAGAGWIFRNGPSGYAEYMRLAPSGNLLIGTTADSGEKLFVQGAGRLVNQLRAYNLLSDNQIKGSAYVELSPDQGTYNAWNIRVGAQAADACYYITGGGYNILTTEGYNNPYTVKLYSNSIATLTMTNGAATFSSSVTASSLIKSGGTSAQYLMADGSVSTLTNPVTGTGTTNYVPKFTSASAIGNSQIFDNGTSVGIGTAIPSQKLQVTGAIEVGPSSTSGGAMIYQTYNSPSYIGSIGSEYSSGAMLIGYGATGKSGASGYVSTFDNFSGTRGLISLAGGNFSILSSISAVSTAVGGDLTMTTNLVVTAAGNVGIGTTSPAVKFVVSNSGASGFEVDPTGGIGAGPILQAFNRSTSAYMAQSYYALSHTFNVGSGAATRAVDITSAGNVGIGTTSPGAKLEIYPGTITGASTQEVLRIDVPGDNIFSSATGYINFRGYDISNGVQRDVAWIGTELVPNLSSSGWFGGNLIFRTTATGNAQTPQERVRITAAGNVGIGNTNPNALLTIKNSATDTRLELDTEAAGGSVLAYDRTASAYKILYLRGSDIQLNPNDVNAVTVKVGGNVGIGTTSPAEKLHAIGNIKIEQTSNVSAILTLNPNSGALGTGYQWNLVGVNSAASYAFQIREASTAYLHINNSAGGGGGNVGIGTTAPQVKLSVQGTQNNTIIPANAVAKFVGGDAGIFVGNLAGTPNYGAWLQAMRESDGLVFPLHLQPNGGNVGIGTTAPAKLLSVRSLDNAVTPFAGFYALNESQGVEVWYGGIQMGGSNGDVALSLASKGAEKIVFLTNSSEKMRITSAGNVGIGTTAPTQLLSVAGNTDLGNSIGSVTSSTYTTRLSGYALYYDASNRYGNYGVLLLNADSGWTSSSRRFMITNGYSANKFAIIRSVDSTTDPALGVGGSVTSGTVDFEINNAGAATFGSSVTASSLIKSGGTAAQFLKADGTVDSSTYLTANQTITLSGVVTGSGTTAITTAIANGAITNAMLANSSFFVGTTSIDLGRASAAQTLTGVSIDGNAATATNVAYSGLTGTVPTWNQNTTGSAATLTTARTLTIGATGKTFDGSANVSWTLGEIGAQAALTNPVTGTGTTNYVPKFTGASAIGNSLIFDDGTNVGIGTASPAYKLDVSGIGNFSNGFSGPSSETGYRLKFYDNGGTHNDAGIGLDGAGGGGEVMWFNAVGGFYFGLGTSGTKVTISNTGNVGIGTTAPNAKLDVAGQIRSYAATGQIYSYSTTSSNTAIVFAGWTSGTGMQMGYLPDTAQGYVENTYPITVGEVFGDIYFRQNSAGTMVTRMTIKADGGNVGIGTTGPTEKLHVDGSTLITYNNSFQSTNSVGNKAILARVSPTSGIINYAEYATATNLNGFVIGSDDARVKGNITGDSLEFITNTSTRMTILSGGNVGINTTTPGSTLHVVGDVLIQTGALGVGVNPNATDGRIDASNDIVAFSTSDKRLKENITPIANALEKVRSLTGVEFDWKEETKSVHGYEGHDVGVIAQDVQAVLPEAVRTNDSGYLSVRYEKMIALLIEANKELANRVEQLEKLIK
jgi:hypothetical protein